MYTIEQTQPITTNPMLPDLFRVERRIKETHDTFTLELAARNPQQQFSFAPGQFNMLYVYGVGEVPISISGDPAQPERLIHTTRAVGTVTQAMSRLRAGDLLGVRGPYGTAWPIEEAKGQDVLLIAGGIGLAPLRPALYTILSRRAEYGKVILLYGARTPTDLLFFKELERWRGRFDMQVRATVDQASGEWLGNVGVVTRLIAGAHYDPSQALAMICGPEVMMRFTIIELQRQGVEPGPDLRLYGAKHEVRRGLLRALPVRARLHLPGWAGFRLSPCRNLD